MQHLASSAFLRKKVLGFDGFDTVEGLDYLYIYIIYLQSVVKAGFNSQGGQWKYTKNGCWSLVDVLFSLVFVDSISFHYLINTN